MPKIHGQCQKIFIFSALFALSACYNASIIPETKKVDYKSAKAAPTLEIPPDLSQLNPDERFAVPESQGRGRASFLDYQNEREGLQANASTFVLPNLEKIKVVRNGNIRWLTVQESPEKLWKTIKTFWEETGFLIEVERPEAGIMETNWAENRAKLPDDLIRKTIGRFLDSIYSTGERDKFRTRLEPSVQSGFTDVFISHRGMQEVYTSGLKEDTRWQPRQSDPELEAEMLRRLMMRLGLNESTADAAMQKEELAPAQAELITSTTGAKQLQLNDNFEGAWRKVGLALDRIGFTVEDRNRQEGIYFVRYVDTDKKSNKSWFAFWKSEEPLGVQYRMYLKPISQEHTLLQILRPEGGEEQSETATQILNLLLEQLR